MQAKHGKRKAKQRYEAVYFINSHVVSEAWPFDPAFVHDCIALGSTTFAMGRVLYVFAPEVRP